MVLQRCGARPVTLTSVRHPFYASAPVIDDRIVAWGTGRDGGRDTLRVQSLRRGVRRAIVLPAAERYRLLLVARRLYVVLDGRLLRVVL